MAINGRKDLLPSSAKPWVKELEKTIATQATTIARQNAAIVALQKLVK